jgi:nucleoid-associated protein YgaU
MSSSTATRTSRLTRPAATTSRSTGRAAAPRRTLTGPGCAVGGRTERPMLRIVADDERGPIVTRLTPAPVPEVEPVETPLRRVVLEDFFAPEYDGDDARLEVLSPRRRTVRLTRRGRLLVFAASVVAVLGVGFAAASASIASDHPEQTTVVTVTPGQTLWDISATAAAGGDVRSMMSHIEALNHLDSASLQAGQHLRIPR